MAKFFIALCRERPPFHRVVIDLDHLPPGANANKVMHPWKHGRELVARLYEHFSDTLAVVDNIAKGTYGDAELTFVSELASFWENLPPADEEKHAFIGGFHSKMDFLRTDEATAQGIYNKAPATIYTFTKDGDTEQHRISVEWRSADSSLPDGIGRQAVAIYYGGSADIRIGTEVAVISASFDEGSDYCEGSAMLGNGRIDIEAPFQGMGLGTLLMTELVIWLRSIPNVQLVPINLSGEDAGEGNLPRRNAFYRKFGIEFPEKAATVHGESLPMTTHQLTLPPLEASMGWTVTAESTEGRTAAPSAPA